MRPLAIFLLGAAFALPVCAGEAQPVAAQPGAADAHPAPFLWQVQGAKVRHALMGSVHLLPEAAHPLPASLEAAYADTRALVLETDLDALSDPELQSQMLTAARDDRPGGIRKRIGAPLYAKLQKRAGALGMPLPACDDLRAWFCALTLELYPLQQAQFSADYGLDQYFYQRAQDDGRPVTGLETAAQQIGLFTGLPDALSVQMIREALDDQSYNSQAPAELFRIWRAGDVATLEKLMKEMRKRYPQLYERLLASRNRAWLPQLIKRLNGETPLLVVVGAGHLVGADGLIAALRARGFDIKAAPAVSVEPAKPAPAPGP